MIYSLKDFVSIPSYVLNDEKLSYRAKGVYAVISYLSQEHDNLIGTILIEDIKKAFGECEVDLALAELEKKQYATITPEEVTI